MNASTWSGRFLVLVVAVATLVFQPLMVVAAVSAAARAFRSAGPPEPPTPRAKEDESASKGYHRPATHLQVFVWR